MSPRRRLARAASVLALVAAVIVTVATSPGERDDSSATSANLDPVTIRDDEVASGEITFGEHADAGWYSRLVTVSAGAPAGKTLLVEVVDREGNVLGAGSPGRDPELHDVDAFTSCADVDCASPVRYRVRSLEPGASITVSATIRVIFQGPDDIASRDVAVTIGEPRAEPGGEVADLAAVEGPFTLEIDADQPVSADLVTTPPAGACPVGLVHVVPFAARGERGWRLRSAFEYEDGLANRGHDRGLHRLCGEDPAPGEWLLLSGAVEAPVQVDYLLVHAAGTDAPARTPGSLSVDQEPAEVVDGHATATFGLEDLEADRQQLLVGGLAPSSGDPAVVVDQSHPFSAVGTQCAGRGVCRPYAVVDLSLDRPTPSVEPTVELVLYRLEAQVP